MTPEDRKLMQQLRDAAVDLTEAYNEWYGVYLGKKTNENPYKEFIAAADAALSQPASEDARPAPEGFVLVPVEPTDAMVQATHNLDLSYMPTQWGADRAAVYKAMIAAAGKE